MAGGAARKLEAREGGQSAGARDRARAGWDRVRMSVSELSWRRFRRAFRKKRRAVVEGPVLAVELVGAVLWMAAAGETECAWGVHGDGRGRRQQSNKRQSWQ